MSHREKVLARRKIILETVKAGGATVKELAAALKIGRQAIRSDIHAIDGIHWQDDVLYFGERL